MTRLVRVTVVTTMALLLSTWRVHAEDSLAAARDLYAQAAYADALKMLEGVAVRAAGEERDMAQLYRVMCLVALGRKADADQAIDALVIANPRFRPATEDVAPRVMAAFKEARRKMLPGTIQRTYATSKAAFDRQEFAEASRGFKDLLESLNDPDLGAAGGESPLSDLRVLAGGFYDLSVKAAVPPPLPAAPVMAPRVTAPRPTVDTTRIYSPDDAKVIPPTVVRQDVPQFRTRIDRPQRGTIELIIDETGKVASASMRVPLTGPAYNEFAISTAQTWQYRPATLDGVPVKFRKVVTVNLQ